MIEFSAEVLTVTAKKVVSGDKIYRVILETSEEAALLLEDYIADRPIQIRIESD